MKKFFMLLAVMAVAVSYSQTYIKVNSTTAAALVPHFGVETSIGKKMTFQFDALASFWSIRDKPFQTLMLFPEVRYHFNEKFNGFYAGAHIGGSKFKIQKWNYLTSDLYQEGYNIFMGVTVGYEWKMNDKWVIDIFIGGGNQQASYKGYYIGKRERYEDIKHYNKSGEWLPYRGGIMFSYKF